MRGNFNTHYVRDCSGVKRLVLNLRAKLETMFYISCGEIFVKINYNNAKRQAKTIFATIISPG